MSELPSNSCRLNSCGGVGCGVCAYVKPTVSASKAEQQMVICFFMDFIGLAFRKLLAGIPCDSETEGAVTTIGVQTTSVSYSAFLNRKIPTAAAKSPA